MTLDSPKDIETTTARADSLQRLVSRLLVVAFGGGVNSTAMLVEMSRRGIKPALIIFADTGGERPETYETVKTVSGWCEAHGLPAIVTVAANFQGKPESLESFCLRRGVLPSIAYGSKNCSQRYKSEPVDRYLNRWPLAKEEWKAGRKLVKAIGFDAGEERRAKPFECDKYDSVYPLIEWNIYREDCVAICKSEGLPTAKSSCFFCPSMKKHEILTLAKEHPELLQRAVAMEQNAAAKLEIVKGLGRHFSWEGLVSADASQMKLFCDSGTPETPCGCYDG